MERTELVKHIESTGWGTTSASSSSFLLFLKDWKLKEKSRGVSTPWRRGGLI